MTPPPRPPLATRSTARNARLAVGLLAFLVLAMNAAVALLLYTSSRTQQRLFEEGLRASGSFISGTLTRDATFFLEASFNSDLATTDLQSYPLYAELPSAQATLDALGATSRRGDLVKIALITLDGRVLFDPSDEWEFGAAPPYLDLAEADRLALAQGSVVLLPRAEDTAERHVLQGITDGDGRIVAALWLRSTLGPAPELETLARRLILAGLLTVLLVGLLWWSLSRLIRRSEEAEREATRADRLRALGAATAGIAHEIRNPLGIMMLSVEELRARIADLPPDEVSADLHQLSGDLEEETRRLRLLTDQFLEMARPTEIEADPLPLAEAVRETVRLFEKGLPAHVSLRLSPMDETARVAIPAAKLRQVLLNLLGNAVEAIPEGQAGEIRVALEKRDARVHLVVADNGRGIPPEVVPRVFDPFFTTRSTGNGLGLALCRSIIEGTGGEMDLKSAVGKGTEVRVLLPVAG